jgi:hypothetical protein
MTAPSPDAASSSGSTATTGSVDSTATVVPGSVGAVVTTQVTIGAIESEAAQAVQVGIGAAHAAIWTYGLISAYDSDDSSTIRADRLANEQVRDSANDLLSSVGVEPVRTEAAYKLPIVVGDKATAQQVAVVVEKDCTNAWRAVIGSTDNYQLRRFALTALSGAAVRLTGWRVLAGQPPTTVPFPGNEGA